MIRKKIGLGLLLLSGGIGAESSMAKAKEMVIQRDIPPAPKPIKKIKKQDKKVEVKKEEAISVKPAKKVSAKSQEEKVSSKKVKKIADVQPQDVITVAQPVRKLHNKIVLRIPSVALDAKDIMITERMLQTKSLEGRTRTRDEIIFEYCVYDKAVNGYHMTPAKQEAEQHIESLKNQYGLSQKDIEKLFKESGMTYEEGIEQLVMFYTNRAFLSNLVSSKVLVTEDEIKKYYEANPEVVPTSYKLEKAFLEKEAVPEEAIENLRKYGLGQDNIVWQPAYWIIEEDLVESKKFITKMHEGVVKVVDADDKWEVVRLLKKVETHIKPLAERYGEITGKLQGQKFAEKLEKFKKDLMHEYSIIEVA